MIKLARQVFLCANGITKINGGSKELPFALLAACHGRNLILISQDDEVALCHGADSLSQFQRLCHHKEVRHEPSLENRPLPVLTAQNCCCSAAQRPRSRGNPKFAAFGNGVRILRIPKAAIVGQHALASHQSLANARVSPRLAARRFANTVKVKTGCYPSFNIQLSEPLRHATMMGACAPPALARTVGSVAALGRRPLGRGRAILWTLDSVPLTIHVCAVVRALWLRWIIVRCA